MKKFSSIIVLSVFILSAHNAFAVYNASDVIGQRDGSNLPSYTTNSANNGGSVGARGFSSEVRAIKIDTTNHRLFVADRNNNRVMVFNLDSNNELVDYDADNVIGQSSLTSADAVACTATSVGSPSGIGYDSTNNRLFVVSNHSGTNSRVMVFNLSGGITDGMAASNVLGQADLTTCASTVSRTQKNLYFPFDILYDNTSGLLYVSDLAHNRVMAYDGRPGVASSMTVCGVTTTGLLDNMDASCVLGQPNFITATSGNSDIKINGALGLALDTTNNRLYVSEYAGNRIKVFDTSTFVNGSGSNGISASYVLGQADFTSSAAGTTQSTLSWPGGLTRDATSGLLYVSDEVNHRVMVFDTSGTITTGMNASYVLGADDFTTINSTVTASTIGAAHGIVYDTTNKTLYVNDTTNSRILLFKPTISIQSSTLNSGKVTRSYSESITISNNQQTPSLELVSGTLPSGISISGTSLVGRAIEVGTYNFVLKAIDTGIHGIFSSDDTNFSIDIQYLPSTSGTITSSYGSKVNNEVLISENVPSVDNNNTSNIKVCAAFSKSIKLGKNNDKDEVKLWQQFLNNGESENLTIDGIYGRKSRLAIMKFQKKYKISSDGIIGPKTEDLGNRKKICY